MYEDDELCLDFSFDQLKSEIISSAERDFTIDSSVVIIDSVSSLFLD